MNRWTEAILLLAIVSLGAALRFADLSAESIWLDEAFSLDMASRLPQDIWEGRPLDPGNPPGYYVTLHPWLQQFGVTVEAGRAFSGMAGVLGIFAAWLLCWSANQPPAVRILTALLVAVSPPLVYLGRETRAYTLFTLMVTLALAAGEALVHKRSQSSLVASFWWLVFILAGASLSYLHYYSFLLLAVIGLYLFVRLLPQGWKPIVCLILAYLAIVGAFLPWLDLFRQQIALGTTRGGATWLLHLLILPLYSVAGATLVWKEDGMPLVAGLTALVLFVIYLPTLYWAARERKLPWVSLAIPFGLVGIAVLISVVKSPMLQSRYLAPTFPFLMLAIASGIHAGFRVWPRGARVVSITLAAMIIASLSLLYTKRHKEDWRPIAGTIARSGNTLPVFCYEDVAHLSLGYTSPWLDIRPIDPVRHHFSPAGKGWEKSGMAEELRKQPEGCWLVLYLSLPETMPELPAIDRWIREQFDVTNEYGGELTNPRFPFLYLYRLQPKQPVKKDA